MFNKLPRYPKVGLRTLIVGVFWNRNQEMWELAMTVLSAGMARVIAGFSECLLIILKYIDLLMEAGCE